MTPKEKAKELVYEFTKFHTSGVYSVVHQDVAKQFAIKSVDNILHVIDRDMNYQNVYSFYLNVKEEIEKL